LKNTLIVILILLYFSHTQAQHITFCKAYTENGDPIDLIYTKEFSFNLSVCILLNAGNKKISESSVFLFVDRITESGRQNQFNKVIRVDKDKNWIAQNYKFIKDGKFEIYFLDANKNRLALTSVIVAPIKEQKSLTQIPTNFYPTAEIILCEKIQDGLPVNIKHMVSLQRDKNAIYIYLKNNTPFDMEKFSMRLFRKTKYALGYDEFVTSKKYRINMDWADAYFQYKFDKPGEYKLDIYDEKDLLIKTAYISVVN
jgi:hypothetical protein